MLSLLLSELSPRTINLHLCQQSMQSYWNAKEHSVSPESPSKDPISSKGSDFLGSLDCPKSNFLFLKASGQGSGQTLPSQADSVEV